MEKKRCVFFVNNPKKNWNMNTLKDAETNSETVCETVFLIEAVWQQTGRIMHG